jgi:hypothetical protein
MSLKITITNDIKTAMKSGNEFELGVLRMLIAAINNKGIENRGKGLDAELTDEEIIDLLSKESKKRKESAEIYKQANREELAKKELEEVEVIKKYLPAQLSDTEIEEIIEKAIKETGATTIKDLGKVMGLISKDIKGKADSGMVGNLVKKKLGLNH